MPLGIGETFAGYRILRLLGAGGMGEVYLAQHPRLPRQDALKVLRSEVSSDGTFQERFIREADLAAGLWHPHIVGVHDRGECDGQLWIAMDYVDGIDVSQLMQQRYPAGMPAQEVGEIISAVANALDYAHKRGLLHRDIKPANIMLSGVGDERRVLLTDFGIARPVDEISGLTTTNMAVGTVAYCAPEQLLGDDIDGRADQYALAATSYQLLTGLQLFPHSNPAVVISRHLNTSPPSVGEIRPELAELDPVLRAALAKNPDDRYRSCAAFSRALRGGSSAGEAAVQLDTATQSARQPSQTPVDGGQPLAAKSLARTVVRRKTVGLVGAGAVVLVGAIALALSPWEAPSSDSRNSSIAQTSKPTAETTFPSMAPAPSVGPIASPTFSPRNIDEVLLTDDQIGRLVGAAITDNPAAGEGTGQLALDSSSYGTADHSTQVSPRSCVGVVFAGEHDVYSASTAAEIKTQTFGHLYGSASGRPHLLQQTAAVFPSAADAEEFVSASQSRWATCARGAVSASLGYENGASYALSNVRRDGDVIVIDMATNGGLNGPDACQQAMGVRNNVVVESRSCEIPDIRSTYDSVNGWPRDPNWAVPDAERIAKAMLENVTS